MKAMDPSDEVTVVVRRHILPGHEAQFEHAMRDFVNFVLACPGHVGISVLRPNDGNGEYVVVDRFANAAARKALVSSPEYERWMKLLGAHTEGEPDMQEMNGLDAWLNQPGSPMKTPPRYKTAVATYLGVCVVIFLLNITVGDLIHSLPAWLSFLFFNACVVALLTWVFMPLISRMLSSWLFSRQGEAAAETTSNHDENNEK